MAFLAVSLLVVGGLLSWTSQNAFQTQRYQDYQTTLAVQNVAGEYVVANMHADLRAGGLDQVMATWASYPVGTQVHLESMSDWADYEFAIELIAEPSSGPRISEWLGPYGGLQILNQEFRIKTGAQWHGSTRPVAAAVEEWVQVVEIPIFAFAALYDFDLSFITPPGENIALDGRVHSNQDIYTYPSGTLTFGEHVTSARTNYPSLHPNDLGSRDAGTVIYEKENGGQVGRMQVPGAGDDPRALIEAEYLTRAHLIITVYNDQILATSAIAAGNFTDYVTNFVSTNSVFHDRRELKDVQATEIDMAKFVYEDYADLATALGAPPAILYVEDLRTPGEGWMRGVRVTNGRDLPAAGLTLVTPNPLYVHGHYNAPLSGTKRPAALVADAVTILSGAWTDPGDTISVAQPTMVNAAILTGIVPSEGAAFDGGLFNGLRMLEDWRGQTLTFNGSMVVLYPSAQALEPWRADVTVYYAPTRQWAFDPDFLNPDYLPWTPVVCTLVRADWSLISPGEVFSD